MTACSWQQRYRPLHTVPLKLRSKLMTRQTVCNAGARRHGLCCTATWARRLRVLPSQRPGGVVAGELWRTGHLRCQPFVCRGSGFSKMLCGHVHPTPGYRWTSKGIQFVLSPRCPLCGLGDRIYDRTGFAMLCTGLYCGRHELTMWRTSMLHSHAHNRLAKLTPRV